MILIVQIVPIVGGITGGALFTLLLREANQRKANVQTTSEGIGTSYMNDNCSFGGSRSKVTAPLGLPENVQI